MIAKSRVDKIEKGLTPQQVVLNWIADKMRRFSSFEELGEWQIEQPGSEAPLNKTAKAAREAVRAAMKGQPKGSIEHAEDRAIKDAHFLVRLFINANEMLIRNTVLFRLEAEKSVLRLRLWLMRLAVWQDVWETHFFLCNAPGKAAAIEAVPEWLMQRLEKYRLEGEEFWPRDEADVGPAAAAQGEQAEPSWFSELTDVGGLREEIIDYAIKAYLVSDVIEALRRSYFAGQPILFPANSRYLEAVVKQAESLVRQYNVWVPRNPFRLRLLQKPGDGEPTEDETPPEGLIDLEEIKSAAAANVRRNVAHDVSMAKAETLAGLGMNEEACRLGREAFHKHYGPKKPE